MDRRRGLVAALWLIPLVGLAGCHLMGGSASDLGAGRGRVDRTYPASLKHSTRAMIVALDDLRVTPEGGSVRAMTAVSDMGKRGWEGQTNAEFFPENETFHDLFDAHQLNAVGVPTAFFNPVQVSYKGQTAEGKAVNVIVRSQPPDAATTLVMVRVGRDGDEAWGRTFLDKVNAHLEAKGQLQPAAAASNAPPATPPPAGTTPAAADSALPPLPQ